MEQFYLRLQAIRRLQVEKRCTLLHGMIFKDFFCSLASSRTLESEKFTFLGIFMDLIWLVIPHEISALVQNSLVQLCKM